MYSSPLSFFAVFSKSFVAPLPCFSPLRRLVGPNYNESASVIDHLNSTKKNGCFLALAY